MTANIQSSLSNRYRFFLWASAFLVLINLLVMNDWMALWQPWEVANLEALRSGSQSLSLPQRIIALGVDVNQTNLFLLRLPGVLVLLLGLVGAYFLSRPIFGTVPTINGGLVLSTSLVVLFCAKLFVGDTWLLASQALVVLAMLRYLKQASLKNALLFWLLAILALLIHTWSSVLAIVALGLYLRWFHPQGKRLDKLGYWILPGLLFFTQARCPGFILSYGDLPYWKFLGIVLAGFLPWTGFLVASWADWGYKFRKREEMAVILGGLVLAGLVAQSLLLALPLALLIARQLSAYFQVNYPYKSMTRGFAIVHLLASFFMITLLLLASYSQIGAAGFRGIMTTGAFYWMLTFIAVIGLFGDQRRLILGGMVGAALLTFFMFWLRTYPVFIDYLQ